MRAGKRQRARKKRYTGRVRESKRRAERERERERNENEWEGIDRDGERE